MHTKILSVFLALLYVFVTTNCEKKKNPTEPEENPPDTTQYVSQPQTDIPWPSLANSPWPMAHHDPQLTGRSPYQGPQLGELVWAVNPVGDFETLTGISLGADGSIYYGTGKNPPYLCALNPDGTEKWHFDIGGNEISATPLVAADGTIYIPSKDHHLYAINPDGTLKWKFDAGEKIQQAPNIGQDGTVYFVAEDEALYAVSKSGELMWRTTVDGGFNWSPVTMISISPDGLNFYIAGLDSNFYAVSNNGILQWKLSLEAVLGSMPVVDNQGNIFITPIQNLLPDSLYLYCINPDGVIKWRVPYSKNSDYWAQYCDLTIDKNGFIYIANNSCDQIISFDYMGQTRWQWSFTDPHEGISASLVCDVNGTVFFGSYAYKNFYALSKDCVLKWELQLPNIQVCYSPAIGDNGCIYFSGGRGGMKIYCLK